MIEINEYINIKPYIIDHGFLGFEQNAFALTPQFLFESIHFIIPLQCFTNADWLKNPNIINVGLCSAVPDQHSSRD